MPPRLPIEIYALILTHIAEIDIPTLLSLSTTSSTLHSLYQQSKPALLSLALRSTSHHDPSFLLLPCLVLGELFHNHPEAADNTLVDLRWGSTLSRTNADWIRAVSERLLEGAKAGGEFKVEEVIRCWNAFMKVKGLVRYSIRKAKNAEENGRSGIEGFKWELRRETKLLGERDRSDTRLGPEAKEFNFWLLAGYRHLLEACIYICPAWVDDPEYNSGNCALPPGLLSLPQVGSLEHKLLSKAQNFIEEFLKDDLYEIIIANRSKIQEKLLEMNFIYNMAAQRRNLQLTESNSNFLPPQAGEDASNDEFAKAVVGMLFERKEEYAVGVSNENDWGAVMEVVLGKVQGRTRKEEMEKRGEKLIYVIGCSFWLWEIGNEEEVYKY